MTNKNCVGCRIKSVTDSACCLCYLYQPTQSGGEECVHPVSKSSGQTENTQYPLATSPTQGDREVKERFKRESEIRATILTNDCKRDYEAEEDELAERLLKVCKEWAKGLVGERMIEQFIHAHGEYLPTLCEDSGQPEWNVGEVRRFAKGLYSLFTKAIEGGE